VPKANVRDDFSPAGKRRLAARAGHICSNPSCHAPTSGPQLEEEKSVNVGVAAHILGAAEGGPRYNPNLTAAERSSIRNGIWLCQNCAKLIDNDELGHPESLLVQWKASAEQDARRQVGKAQRATSRATNAERLLKRDLKVRDELQKDLVRPWEEIQRERSRRPDGRARPFDKFRFSKLVIHRLGDDTYPGDDNRPGISSWFRLEPFDFYHRGIKFVLGIESGVIENCAGYARNLHWAFTPFGAAFDPVSFRGVNIWRLGLIPYRNIRHYDLKGDEYYNTPHLYCDFSINGMPYEQFEYAVVANEGEFYDWPLNPALQLPSETVILTSDDDRGPRSDESQPEPADPAPRTTEPR
jgi:hypothetical protein